MDKQNIACINVFSAIAKKRVECREKNLVAFRAHFKVQLDDIDINYDDGTTLPLKDWKKVKSNNGRACRTNVIKISLRFAHKL